ncbi:MAG: aminotransferase class I/II-fold pyridoxal phosphate-dependent enzyme [Thaumarchaeota archaeon]|nr:aminotransferase class I/II-fold pyridoxal phosphate-dependent enzyme [Nitrososphaerota archaeon]
MSAEKELSDLREQVADTTREIIDLIAARNDIAKKIGVLKTRDALPVEDARVEDGLVRLVIRECEDKGLDKQTGLKVLSTLLAEGKRVQGFQNKQPLITPMMMSAKAQQIEATGKQLLRLDVGEPNFHPPKAVLDATSQALYDFKTHYTGTRGIPELVAAVRRYLERKHHFAAKDSEVIVNPGGRFGVYLALSTTLKEGESAVVVEPNWPAYKEGLQYIGARAIPVHTTLEEGWEPSVEAIHDAIRPNTKAIILSYPANPTGAMISPAKFKEIVDVANEHKLTVISDEIYTDYASKPCPTILEAGAQKFILTASFSKTWAMTGFRVGYTVSSEDTVSKMMKIQSLLVTCVPEFIQYGAIKALDSDPDVVKNAAAMRERVGAACHELDAIGALQYVKPDGAMYVFPQARKPDFDSVSFTMKLLEEKGVTISPGTGFGDYPSAFRLSLGGSKETIVEGIRKIGEQLA